jgi:hypothetical protein
MREEGCQERGEVEEEEDMKDETNLTEAFRKHLV